MDEGVEVPLTGVTPRTAPALERDWERGLKSVAILVLAAAYAFDTSLRAVSRPLWFDELISYYVALLPKFATLWEALRQTADGQPPFMHLAMRTSYALFGTSEWAARLPSMVGVGAMSWALYVFVGRRAGAVYGIAAVVFSWNTWAYEYANEARPYALLMGLCGLAFLCRRAAATGTHRRWALAGLAACLVALMSSHYYAGLLLLPLGVGELVRSRLRRRIDWAIWSLLGLAPLTLLLYLPLLAGVRAEYQLGFWSPAGWIDLSGFYLVLLAPAFIPLCLALTVAGVAKRFERGRGSHPGGNTTSVFPPDERAAVYTMAALPMIYVLVTMVLTGAFVYRYPLAALFGISVVFAEVLFSWLGPAKKAAWIVCAVLFGAFLWNRGIPSTRLLAEPPPRQQVAAVLDQVRLVTKDSHAPIVMASPQLYLEYNHYADAHMRSRLVYLADPEAALEFAATNSCDISLIKLAPWGPLHVEDHEPFLAEHSCFFVLDHKRRRFAWLAPRLRSEGEDLEVISDGEGFQVLRRCKKPAAFPIRRERRTSSALGVG